MNFKTYSSKKGLSHMNSPRLKVVLCASASGLHRMAYQEWGDPSNPDVVLCVHGLTRNSRDFDSLAQKLQHRYRVICPDVVGRGLSDWLLNPMGYQVAQYAADMVSLLNQVQPGSLRWVGTSMGGLIGMTYAGMLAAHAAMPALQQGLHIPPAQVNHPLPPSTFPIHKLVLNDVGPHIEPESLARIGQYTSLPTTFQTFNECVAYTQTIAASFGPHTPEQWRQLTQYYFIEVNGQWVKHYDPNIGQAFVAITPEMWKQSEQWLWGAYASISVPNLIIHGADSDLLSFDTVAHMLKVNSFAQVYTVDGVGHAPTIMNEEQITAVEKFLNDE
jgi:pimeloyl-ACP methyl ester carboxylesterase